MSLEQEKFDTLIARLEKFARQQPTLYKFRVALLALFGYTYIFVTLGILLGLFVIIIYGMFIIHKFNYLLIKFAIVIFLPIPIILRSLWVTFPHPQGLELHRQDVPQLFALVDKLRTKLRTAKLDHILLTSQFNASVVQRPRLGLFGWQENYLILGLPLMQALSPEQLSAVLAHELGHLSGNHSRFGGWIYRLQKTYYQMFERLQASGDHIASVVLVNFFNWYAPFFTAYSFVLRRMNEYEADRCSAELAGAENTAQALINADVKSQILDHYFWTDVSKQVYEITEPPANIYTEMFNFLQNGIQMENADRFLQQALVQKTDNHDTHPCLTDRLQALGCLPTAGNPVTLPQPFAVSAASEYLGNALEKLTAYINNTWQTEVQTTWRQQYAEAQGNMALLRDLDRKVAENQCLSQEDMANLSVLTLKYRGEDAAVPWLEKILATAENDVLANYNLGQILLSQNDIKGIEYIEKAIAQKREILIEGCNLIYSFFKKQGDLQSAKIYKHRAEENYNLVLMAKRERSYISPSDRFQTHRLSEEVIQNLSEQLSYYPTIKKVYFTEKIVQHFPGEPCYLLLIEEIWKLISVGNQGQQLIRKIIKEVKFPGFTLVVLMNRENEFIRRKMRKIEGSIIYQKQN